MLAENSRFCKRNLLIVSVRVASTELVEVGGNLTQILPLNLPPEGEIL
jgi:hypothetical protein